MQKKKVQPNNQEKRIVTAKEIKKERLIKNVKRVTGIFLAVFLPLVLVFCAQVLQRNSIDYSFEWMSQNVGMVAINMAILYIVFFALYAISKNHTLSFAISSILYMILPLISRLKYDVRGEVLLVNDFALISNVGEVASFAEFSNDLTWELMSILLFIIISAVILFLLKFKMRRRTGIVNMLLFTAVLVVVFTNQEYLKAFGINENVRFAPNVVHDKQGTILGIYSNFEMNKVTEPRGYSKDKIYAILDKSKNEEKLDSFGDEIKSQKIEKYPNIIMIMSESFCDPMAIPNVTYSQDPISYIRKLMKNKNTISGNLISSTFAGGTSNIEYEAFTGNISAFLPYGTVPYTDIGKNLENVQTIQKEFKKNGYKTLAIHSYNGDFYDRNKIYPILGFDDFIEDKELKDVGYYGKYVGDAVVYKNIVEQLKENTSGKPMFIWALTMQNHTPYTISNIEKDAIYVDVSGDKLSKIAKDKLMGYVNNAYELDRRLEILIDYLNESKEPAILMFYGDHMPALYEAYYDTGIISSLDTTKWSVEEMLKLHTIPYFIYQNFDNKIKLDNVQNVGPFKLGNMLLTLSGVNKSSYFRFLDTLKYSALRDRLFMDQNGKTYEEIQQDYFDQINEHKMLQYDMIYGENYVDEYDKEK